VGFQTCGLECLVRFTRLTVGLLLNLAYKYYVHRRHRKSFFKSPVDYIVFCTVA
jgi:hypothetical protein